MEPPGMYHGFLEGRIAYLLTSHAVEQRSGRVLVGGCAAVGYAGFLGETTSRLIGAVTLRASKGRLFITGLRRCR
jgi:hypothetical protein